MCRIKEHQLNGQTCQCVGGDSSKANETRKILSKTQRKLLISQIQKITKLSPGIYSNIAMESAGFEYTGDDDTVCCNNCSLKVSSWSTNMSPFTVHAERSPDCEYVRQLKESVSLSNSKSCGSMTENGSTVNSVETPLNNFIETTSIEKGRAHTFSNWSDQRIPDSDQMIGAGFCYCNINDQVLCIYCNLICNQWHADTDDPSEIHRTLSPTCPFVRSRLTLPSLTQRVIDDGFEVSTVNIETLPYSLIPSDPSSSRSTATHAVIHSKFLKIDQRYESFLRLPNQLRLPPVNELVKAGFFYSGTGDKVTCFCCNGSLANWGPKDNPLIEHARWFPHCSYAKRLCGTELHRIHHNSFDMSLILFL